MDFDISQYQSLRALFTKMHPIAEGLFQHQTCIVQVQPSKICQAIVEA